MHLDKGYGEHQLFIWDITGKEIKAQIPLEVKNSSRFTYIQHKLMTAFTFNNQPVCMVVDTDDNENITGYIWINCQSLENKRFACDDEKKKWMLSSREVSISPLGNKYVVIATQNMSTIRIHVIDTEGNTISLLTIEEFTKWLRVIPSGTLDNVFFMCTDRDIHKYAIIRGKLDLVKTVPLVEIINDSIVFNKTHIYGFKNDPRLSHFFKLDMNTMTLQEFQHPRLLITAEGPVLTSMSEQYAAFMIDYHIIIYELATGQLKWTWTIYTHNVRPSTEPRIIHIHGRELYVFRQHSVVCFGLEDGPLLVTNL